MFSKDPLLKKKIFVGFDHAGASGIYHYTRYLKKKGYQIDFYGKVKSPFKVPVDINLEFSSNRLISLFQAIGYFFKILPKYDIWHFNYGQTFFICPLNLIILKIFGKKIICTFRGNDVIRGFDFLPMSLFCKSSNWPEYYSKLINARFGINLLLNWIRKQSFLLFADQIILIGPRMVSSVWRYDEIIPYTSDREKKPQEVVKNKIRIFHAPTDSVVKGTKVIQDIFKKLGREYPQCEFVIKEKLSRDEIKAELARADIVVDQLLVGWYGEQAAEAMALGKVVMAFLNPTYFNFVAFAQNIPIINTNYWTFENDLRNLLDSRQLISKIGIKSFEFAKKYHSPEKIGQQYLRVYHRTLEQ